ncbi:MAG: dTMP kinase [Planctomycetes bacterium]|nr:dTMP kinase [Planctomycetota bacterium]
MFFTFEGIEGSGKSTQLALWADYFRQAGRSVVVTREPGGTPLGVSIRRLLLNTATIHDHRSELLLFFADRLEHIRCVIQPALDRGDVVLCDRYVDSTWAYQKGGRGCDSAMLTALSQYVSVMPDCTFLYDLPVSVGLARAQARAQLDQIEAQSVAFHERVRAAYLALAEQHARIHRIDVMDQMPDAIFQTTRECATLLGV